MNTQEEEYVTLFCEGDGSVGLYTNRNKKRYSYVSFGQKEKAVLEYIASLTAGGHSHLGKDGVWRLEFRGASCVPLLEMFSRHVVSKQFLNRLNKVLEHLGMPLAVQHPLTLEGFVAFWDAEGGSGNQPQIEVPQLDREILDIIAGGFGGAVCRSNTNYSYQWYFCGEEARVLVEAVLKRSRCPVKAERLRQDFEGPNYYELNKEEVKIKHKLYDDTHKDERKVYNKVYNEVHKDEVKAYNKRLWAEQKAIREWMKTHPEEVAKLQESS